MNKNKDEASQCSGSSGSRHLSESDNNSNSKSLVSSTTDISRPRDREELGIAREEDKAVFRIRLAVIGFLLACTIGVACLVYFTTRQSEQDAFDAEFLDFSTKILEAIGSSMEQSLGAIDAFAVSTVSFAQAANMTWPFVTIPNSGTRLSKVRSVTNAAVIAEVTVVAAEDRLKWETYSLQEGPGWVDENLRVQKNDPNFNGNVIEDYQLAPLYSFGGANVTTMPTYYPNWQAYPTASSLLLPFNWDVNEYPSILSALDSLNERKAFIGDVSNDPADEVTADVINVWIGEYVAGALDSIEPISDLFYPIFSDAADEVSVAEGSTREDGKMVAFMFVSFYWRDFMTKILPPGINGLVVVVENACNQAFTYQINGPEAVFKGFGDQHDKKYNHIEKGSSLVDLKRSASGSRAYTGLPLADNQCPYSVKVFPSETFEDDYTSSDPWIYALVAVSIFVFTSIIFLFYDYIVERRQKKVMSTALKSSAIVSSLFPSNVRARLYGLDGKNKALTVASQKNRLKSFMKDGSKKGGLEDSEEGVPGSSMGGPIADLFPETTVMFADIAGFTAWSSTREPSQVFILLESLYGMFDKLAGKRGVFKVETIGDCYVAVTGLPDPRPDHAIVITKFACDCSTQMKDLTARLAITLGPDTEDLSMRYGLNSGPVTAGVLRGQKSRFQLFGDTVNTASRMESSGEKNRIHVSQSTADELIKHKKGHWVRARKDTVEVKGKGQMPTYWVEPRAGIASSDSKSDKTRESTDDSLNDTDLGSTYVQESDLGAKMERLVKWNADVLARLIRAIIARRKTRNDTELDMKTWKSQVSLEGNHQGGHSVIDEVKEFIQLPEFDPALANDDSESVVLDPIVVSQLHEYVSAIASTYGGSSNPFHNFEHASHVCMSVAKLMSRIVATDEFFDQERELASLESFKHKRTFGITSDPLTLFACAFAALIHDVDHKGVPNSQLVKEGTEDAKLYHNRSVAEQRSVDVAWKLLMSERYTDLQRAICSNQSELQRFRQLVVNSVMATDIMDKDLIRLRNERWDKAFQPSVTLLDSVDASRDGVNRKATIVIEHLIQASDVAHTMQHWHVYRKWNARMFAEMYNAYHTGRAEKDPSEFWYKGELGFFDFYIIPLAKKISECGVFGVSSDEYLNYAMKNREEWKLKGEKIVAQMIQTLGKKRG